MRQYWRPTDGPAQPRPAENPREIAHPGRHGIVSGIIKPPYFRQVPALLDCDKIILRWPGPFGSGFLSPQPPGVVRIGPVRSQISPPWANESWSFLFLGVSAQSALREVLSSMEVVTPGREQEERGRNSIERMILPNPGNPPVGTSCE